jgi:hypothetical protein
MTTQPWMAEEPGLRAALRQASRLLRGGLRRKGRTLAVSLFLASSLACWMVLSNHTYSPRFVLRVSEMDQDPGMNLRPRHNLKDYVREAVWTSEPLLKVIHDHGLCALATSADRSMTRIVGVDLLALLLGAPLVALGVGAADAERGPA